MYWKLLNLVTIMHQMECTKEETWIVTHKCFRHMWTTFAVIFWQNLFSVLPSPARVEVSQKSKAVHASPIPAPMFVPPSVLFCTICFPLYCLGQGLHDLSWPKSNEGNKVTLDGMEKLNFIWKLIVSGCIWCNLWYFSWKIPANNLLFELHEHCCWWSQWLQN